MEAVGTASYAYRRVETGSRSLERFPPVENRRERTNRLHDYRGTGGLELHAGRGRIRDVTGVLRALALEQRLLRMKRLSGPLRDETREQLAQLFTVGSDFATVHDEPARAFWREVAAILERDGALLQGGLDAEGLERVQESIARSGRLTLRHGTRLAVVTRLDRMAGHLDEDSHEHFQRTGAGSVDAELTIVESRRTTVDESLSRYGLEFDLARSRGVVATYQLHAEMLYGSGVRRSLDWRALAGCERLLLDRWYVALSAEHLSSSIRAGGGRSEPTWGVVLGGRLSYRLEDHWSVDLSSNHQDLMIRSSLFSPGIRTIAGRQSSSGLRLGFSWRPSGRFDSPTLGIHERAISVER